MKPSPSENVSGSVSPGAWQSPGASGGVSVATGFIGRLVKAGHKDSLFYGNTTKN